MPRGKATKPLAYETEYQLWSVIDGDTDTPITDDMKGDASDDMADIIFDLRNGDYADGDYIIIESRQAKRIKVSTKTTAKTTVNIENT